MGADSPCEVGSVKDSTHTGTSPPTAYRNHHPPNPSFEDWGGQGEQGLGSGVDVAVGIEFSDGGEGGYEPQCGKKEEGGGQGSEAGVYSLGGQCNSGIRRKIQAGIVLSQVRLLWAIYSYNAPSTPPIYSYILLQCIYEAYYPK